MLKIKEIKASGYERVWFVEDSVRRLSSFVAIHNTNLGPACGGIRLLPYPSKADALEDVLRLSRGMSLKSALAGIRFGGGKSVIVLNPARKSPELFQAFGDFVNQLSGKYYAAKDMNVTGSDLLEIKKQTPYVLGIEGVPSSSGDPSPITARGNMRALEATLEEISGRSNFMGVKVAIQGLGHVGMELGRLLRKAGAELWVTDIDESQVKRAAESLDAHTVDGDKIFDLPVEIFIPCAVGGVLNQTTIPRLKVRAVCGCANNQLLSNQDGWRLHERGILYAPDFSVNSGGIINIFAEYAHLDSKKELEIADNIYVTVKELFSISKEKKLPPFVVATEMAEERIYGRVRKE